MNDISLENKKKQDNDVVGLIQDFVEKAKESGDNTFGIEDIQADLAKKVKAQEKGELQDDESFLLTYKIEIVNELSDTENSDYENEFIYILAEAYAKNVGTENEKSMQDMLYTFGGNENIVWKKTLTVASNISNVQKSLHGTPEEMQLSNKELEKIAQSLSSSTEEYKQNLKYALKKVLEIEKGDILLNPDLLSIAKELKIDGIEKLLTYNDKKVQETRQAIKESVKKETTDAIREKINNKTQKNENIDKMLEEMESEVDQISKGLIEAGFTKEDIVTFTAKLPQIDEISLGNQNDFLVKVLTDEQLNRLGINYAKPMEKKDRIFQCLYNIFSIHKSLSPKGKESKLEGAKISIGRLGERVQYMIDVAQASDFFDRHREDIMVGNFSYEEGKVKVGSGKGFPINAKFGSDMILQTVTKGSYKSRFATWIDQDKPSAKRLLDDKNFEKYGSDFDILRTIFFQSYFFTGSFCDSRTDKIFDKKNGNLENVTRFILKPKEKDKFKLFEEANGKIKIRYMDSNLQNKGKVETTMKLLGSEIGQLVVASLIDFYEYNELEKNIASAKKQLGIGKSMDSKGKTTGENIIEVLSQTETIYTKEGTNRKPNEIGGIDDFVKKVYLPIWNNYTHDLNGVGSINAGKGIFASIVGPKGTMAINERQKKIGEDFSKKATKAYLNYLLLANNGEISKNSDNISFLSNFGIIVEPKEGSKEKWAEAKNGGAAKIDEYIDNLLKNTIRGKLETKAEWAYQTFKLDPVKGTIDIAALLGAVIITGLTTAATGGLSIWADAGIFYASEKLLKGVGYGTTDFIREGGTRGISPLGNFGMGFADGIGWTDENHEMKSTSDILIGEVTGYAETLALFKITKPFSAMRGNGIIQKGLVLGVESEGFNIAGQVINTAGECLRQTIKGNPEQAKLTLKQSVDSFLDPAEHLRGFAHSVMTLGMIKGMNKLMQPVYSGITDIQKNLARNIEGKITALNKELENITSETIVYDIKGERIETKKMKDIIKEIEKLEDQFLDLVHEIFASMDQSFVKEMNDLGYTKYRSLDKVANERIKRLKSGKDPLKEEKVNFWEKMKKNQEIYEKQQKKENELKIIESKEPETKINENKNQDKNEKENKNTKDEKKNDEDNNKNNNTEDVVTIIEKDNKKSYRLKINSHGKLESMAQNGKSYKDNMIEFAATISPKAKAAFTHFIVELGQNIGRYADLGFEAYIEIMETGDGYQIIAKNSFNKIHEHNGEDIDSRQELERSMIIANGLGKDDLSIVKKGMRKQERSRKGAGIGYIDLALKYRRLYGDDVSVFDFNMEDNITNPDKLDMTIKVDFSKIEENKSESILVEGRENIAFLGEKDQNSLLKYFEERGILDKDTQDKIIENIQTVKQQREKDGKVYKDGVFFHRILDNYLKIKTKDGLVKKIKSELLPFGIVNIESMFADKLRDICIHKNDGDAGIFATSEQTITEKSQRFQEAIKELGLNQKQESTLLNKFIENGLLFLNLEGVSHRVDFKGKDIDQMEDKNTSFDEFEDFVQNFNKQGKKMIFHFSMELSLIISKLSKYTSIGKNTYLEIINNGEDGYIIKAMNPIKKVDEQGRENKERIEKIINEVNSKTYKELKDMKKMLTSTKDTDGLKLAYITLAEMYKSQYGNDIVFKVTFTEPEENSEILHMETNINFPIAEENRNDKKSIHTGNIDQKKIFQIPTKQDKGWVGNRLTGDRANQVGGIIGFIELYDSRGKSKHKDYILSVLKQGIKDFNSTYEVEDILKVDNASEQEKSDITILNTEVKRINEKHKDKTDLTNDELVELYVRAQSMVKRSRIKGNKPALDEYIEKSLNDWRDNEWIKATSSICSVTEGGIDNYKSAIVLFLKKGIKKYNSVYDNNLSTKNIKDENLIANLIQGQKYCKEINNKVDELNKEWQNKENISPEETRVLNTKLRAMIDWINIQGKRGILDEYINDRLPYRVDIFENGHIKENIDLEYDKIRDFCSKFNKAGQRIVFDTVVELLQNVKKHGDKNADTYVEIVYTGNSYKLLLSNYFEKNEAIKKTIEERVNQANTEELGKLKETIRNNKETLPAEEESAGNGFYVPATKYRADKAYGPDAQMYDLKIQEKDNKYNMSISVDFPIIEDFKAAYHLEVKSSEVNADAHGDSNFEKASDFATNFNKAGKKMVFYFAMELGQNLGRYADHNRVAYVEIAVDGQGGYTMKMKNSFKRFVDGVDMKVKLSEMFEKINNMKADEIGKIIEEMLTRPGYTDGGGAGIGYLDMERLYKRKYGDDKKAFDVKISEHTKDKEDIDKNMQNPNEELLDMEVTIKFPLIQELKAVTEKDIVSMDIDHSGKLENNEINQDRVIRNRLLEDLEEEVRGITKRINKVILDENGNVKELNEEERNTYMIKIGLNKEKKELANMVYESDVDLLLKIKILSGEIQVKTSDIGLRVREKHGEEWKDMTDFRTGKDVAKLQKGQNIFNLLILSAKSHEVGPIENTRAELLVVDGVCGKPIKLENKIHNSPTPLINKPSFTPDEQIQHEQSRSYYEKNTYCDASLEYFIQSFDSRSGLYMIGQGGGKEHTVYTKFGRGQTTCTIDGVDFGMMNDFCMNIVHKAKKVIEDKQMDNTEKLAKLNSDPLVSQYATFKVYDGYIFCLLKETVNLTYKIADREKESESPHIEHYPDPRILFKAGDFMKSLEQNQQIGYLKIGVDYFDGYPEVVIDLKGLHFSEEEIEAGFIRAHDEFANKVFETKELKDKFIKEEVLKVIGDIKQEKAYNDFLDRVTDATMKELGYDSKDGESEDLKFDIQEYVNSNVRGKLRDLGIKAKDMDPILEQWEEKTMADVIAAFQKKRRKHNEKK